MPSLVILQPDPEAPPGLLVERFVAGGAVVAVHECGTGWHRRRRAPPATDLVVLGATAPAVDDSVKPRFLPCSICCGRASQIAGRSWVSAWAPSCWPWHWVVRSGPAAAPEFGYVDLVPTGLAAADPVVVGIGAGLPLMLWHDDGDRSAGGSRTAGALPSRSCPGLSRRGVGLWAAVPSRCDRRHRPPVGRCYVAGRATTRPCRCASVPRSSGIRNGRSGSARSVAEGWLKLVAGDFSEARKRASTRGTSLSRS